LFECETYSKEKKFEKILTDVEKGIYIEKWEVSGSEIGIGDGWRIEKHRLYGGLSDGVDIITLDNGRLSFIVIPTRGMGIWKGFFEGLPLGWDSPVKSPVNPCYVNLEARGGLGWLEGFNEWIVRCGLENFGAPGTDIIIDNMGREKSVMLTLHGKVANIPASKVKVKVGLESPFEIGVEGVTYEQSMFGSNLKMTSSITTTPMSNSIKISDVLENIRGVSCEMQILYHCNYGKPFLEEESRLIAPIRRVAPRDSKASENVENFDIFGPPEDGFIEQVYFFELVGDDEGHTKVVLVNRDETKAVSISFSLKELPYFTLWKNTGTIEDGYVVGLEPGTSFPNPKSFERSQNRIVKLKPKEKYKVEIALAIHLGKEEVQTVKNEILKLTGRLKPTILKEPFCEFSLV